MAAVATLFLGTHARIGDDHFQSYSRPLPDIVFGLIKSGPAKTGPAGPFATAMLYTPQKKHQGYRVGKSIRDATYTDQNNYMTQSIHTGFQGNWGEGGMCMCKL